MRLCGSLLLLAAVALPLAGCATRQPGEPAGPPSATQSPRLLPGAVNAATYIAQAASADLFVIRSSEMAQTRSTNGAIRDFAERMIAAHQGLASQLSFAGRRLNLLPGATLLPEHQSMLDELAASGDFDRSYVRLQRAVHGASLNLHATYAARGTSPTLRPVAANAAAVERSHLEMLRRL